MSLDTEIRVNSLGFAKPESETRVVVAMSGGVDSSVVAAKLKREGYDVIGVTLQLYDHGAALAKKGACCAGVDIHDARRVAEEIGDAAIEHRLAACANLEGPVSSTYRWKSVVEQAFEFVLWLKAPKANWDRIEALVLTHHPYEVPAMVALPCIQANAPYEAWVHENTDT